MIKRKRICIGPIAVRAGSHARVDFDIVPPARSLLIIEHLNGEELLARECQPLTHGVNAQEFKTHPDASHIACSLKANDHIVDGVQFHVDCGRSIEPIARQFIVIGAMKAGTTTLFELLAQHPAICRTWAQTPGVSNTKEINYFRHLYREGNTPLHYDWRFPFDAATHAWTLDVSPNYAQWSARKPVPARIASIGGETKLAYILREPVDRIESHIAHKLRDSGEARNFRHFIRTSRYAMQLDKFITHFERDKILLLDFEKLCGNPAAVLTEVCDFLDIEPFDARTVVHNRRSIGFRLKTGQRSELAEAIRPDVQRLISVYGFKPAETWLRKPVLSWIRSLARRRRA